MKKWCALNILLFVLILANNFLFFNSYPFDAPETVLCFMGAVMLLSLIALLFYSLRLSWFFHAFLIVLFFDMTLGFCHFRMTEGIFTFQDHNPYRIFLRLPSPVYWGAYFLSCFRETRFFYLGAYLITVPVFYGLYLIREKIGKMIFIFFIGVLTAGILKNLWVNDREPLFDVRENPAPAMAVNQKSNILILILDENLGTGGIPVVARNGDAVKKELENIYVSNNFLLYEKAFSSFRTTESSIASFLNYSTNPYDEGLFIPTKRLGREGNNFIIRPNRLLDKFLSDGYRINLYQQHYTMFSGVPDERCQKCLTYSHDSLGYFQFVKMPLMDKTIFLMSAVIQTHQSFLLRRLLCALSWRWKKFSVLPRAHAIASSLVLDRIKQDLKTSSSGTVFFAHLLIPHYPYIYQADGKINPIEDWDYPARERIHLGYCPSWMRPALDIEKTYASYFQQVLYLHRRIAELFEAMRENQTFDKTTILVLSDHGPRMTTLENYPPEDIKSYVSDCSVFFAVKKGDFLIKTSGREKGGVIKDKISSTSLVNQIFQLVAPDESREQTLRNHPLA